MPLTGVPESASFPALLIALAGVGAPIEAHADPTPEAKSAVVSEEDAYGGEWVYDGGSVDAESKPMPLLMHLPPKTVEAPKGELTPRDIDAAVEKAASDVDGLAIEAELLQLVEAQVPQAPAADPVTLSPSMVSNLSRDFVVRLERVADRMWNEHGMRIEVVEGFRSQSRQQQLYAQGRTTPGPVVTWTTRSLHTAGAAADLFIDGSPVTIDQAVLLARAAEQEGLRTLYPFDSGHIQLDRPGYGAEVESNLPRPERQTPVGPAEEPASGVARVAPVAPVARTARPSGSGAPLPDPNELAAKVAPKPTGQAPLDGAGSAKPPAATPPPSLGGSVAGFGDEASQGALTEGKASAARTEGEATAQKAAEPVASGPQGQGYAALDAAAPRTVMARAAPPDGVAGPSPVDPTAFEYEAPRSTIQRLHLPIEGLAGANSIDLGVRGSAVDGWLNVSDPALAAELRRSLHELRQQLGERGLEARAIGVRLVNGAAADAITASSEASSGRAGGEGAHDQDAATERQRSFRDRPSRDTRDRSARPDTREPQEER